MNTFFSFFIGRAHKGRAFRFNLFNVFPCAALREIQKRISASITHATAATAITICLFSGTATAQEVPQDSVKTETIPLDEVIISAVRADAKTPSLDKLLVDEASKLAPVVGILKTVVVTPFEFVVRVIVAPCPADEDVVPDTPPVDTSAVEDAA